MPPDSRPAHAVRPPLPPALRLLLGLLLLVITVAAGLREWGVPTDPARPIIDIFVLVAFALMLPGADRGKLIFASCAVLLTLFTIVIAPDWRAMLDKSLTTTAFLIAFFASMSALGIPAKSSPAILRCGRFLSRQPPGRRYLALTIGGQLFSVYLNYGSIVLLGNMAVANAEEEPDPWVRKIRMRRMLLAIQRAMISTIAWSPLSFSVTFTLFMIPQTDWSHMVLPGLVTGAILSLVGWGVDTVLRPRSSGPARPRVRPEGSWLGLWPLILLLVILASLLLGLSELTGVRIPGIIIVLAPSLAVAWFILQMRRNRPARQLASRAGQYVTTDLPGMRSELLVLILAGYVGLLGGQVIGPLAGDLGFDPASLPRDVILLGLIWIVPLVGQIGIHPLLAVSLMLPMLPSAVALGLTPPVLATAVLAGWSLSSASTPFTATAVLVASYAGSTASEVARRWNGLYALICGVLLSTWVLVYAHLAGV